MQQGKEMPIAPPVLPKGVVEKKSEGLKLLEISLPKPLIRSTFQRRRLLPAPDMSSYLSKSPIMIATEATMAQILVRKVDERLKVRLRSRARENGRSMEEEAREILRDALRQQTVAEVGFGTATAELFRDCGLKEGEEIHEWRGFPVEPITFDE
jgi:plasmid stability protein